MTPHERAEAVFRTDAPMKYRRTVPRDVWEFYVARVEQAIADAVREAVDEERKGLHERFLRWRGTERRFAIALRDSAVHESCRKLGPDDECRWPAFIIGMERCSRARRLIGVPAGMLTKLEDNDGA